MSCLLEGNVLSHGANRQKHGNQEKGQLDGAEGEAFKKPYQASSF